MGEASDLPAAKEAYLSVQRAKKRKEDERRRKEEESKRREQKEEKERRKRRYEYLAEEGRSNQDGVWDEGDFM